MQVRSQGGGYEKLEANKPSHRVCGCPDGFDSGKTSMADESGLRGSLQLPSVLSRYFNKHAEHPHCEFNMAVKVREGHSGKTDWLGLNIG